MVEKPRTVRLRDAAVNYLTREIMPVECMVSLPVPVRCGDRLQSAVFATIAVPTPDRTNCQFYQPMVRVDLDWNDERVIKHTFAQRIEPIAKQQPVGLLYPPQFSGLMTDDLMNQWEESYWRLYQLMDVVGPLYNKRELTLEERVRMGQFRHLFQEWMSRDIVPFYEQLNPDFFQWLEELCVDSPD